MLQVFTKQEVHNKIKHLSASKVSTIMGCKFKWAARYLYDLPIEDDEPTQMLALGRFFHSEAETEAHRGQGFDKGKMLVRMIDTVKESKGLPAQDYYAVLDAFLEVYGDLDLNSENVEVKFYGKMPNFNMHCLGYIDHVIDNGPERLVVDLKLKSKVTRSHGEAQYGPGEWVQMGLYSYFTGIPDTALYMVHVLKKRKLIAEPVIARKTYSPADIEQVLAFVEMWAREMYSLNYPPNRLYDWCNMQMCGYWKQCHQIWGPKYQPPVPVSPEM